MTQGAVFVLAILLLQCPVSVAVTLDNLDPEVEWHTDMIRTDGNFDIIESYIRTQLVTQTRSWYTLWRERPSFLAYRIEYDQLSNVNEATIRRLHHFEWKGVLSGLSLDVLSLLMFGKTTSGLTSGEKVSLQNQALQTATGYIANDLRQSLAKEL